MPDISGFMASLLIRLQKLRLFNMYIHSNTYWMPISDKVTILGMGDIAGKKILPSWSLHILTRGNQRSYKIIEICSLSAGNKYIWEKQIKHMVVGEVLQF